MLTDAILNAVYGGQLPPYLQPGQPFAVSANYPAAFVAQLAPLAGPPGVRLVSLQAGPGSEQIAALGGRFPVVELPGRRGLEALLSGRTDEARRPRRSRGRLASWALRPRKVIFSTDDTADVNSGRAA